MLETTRFQLQNTLSPWPPRAAQLIVTIYGDIVEPRGGVLWMGDLIRLCSAFEINESLVRTAVSRLVSTGQLSGEKAGRRSFYALTPSARKEFHAAADLFFGAPDPDCDWLLVHCVEKPDQTLLQRLGFAQLNGTVFVGADRGYGPLPGLVFRSRLEEHGGETGLDTLRAAFDLSGLHRDYLAFTASFSGLGENIGALAGEQALIARLALVHAYRAIRLRDPRLPSSALPKGWGGAEARGVFAATYRALSPAADAYIGRQLTGLNGLLPEATNAVRNRLKTLSIT
ncbi:PaaX family transcriptional regulator [Roseibium denhamense]|uniref:Transcriptional regulator, PaaX family n=1 Tax=Roseibium denhamense TaxID=76305 RepID=A0ABY1PE44_9HYPH|nr:PaaX family transcriptional regulator C-terminal domain-containing protein [Roseibium denhamense]MTI06139.1 PaaX family transcriptional regulator [Roseibium denhamense]SMP32185.1 transcriptional regulator, PaaX family [Roseibium denhamense]